MGTARASCVRRPRVTRSRTPSRFARAHPGGPGNLSYYLIKTNLSTPRLHPRRTKTASDASYSNARCTSIRSLNLVESHLAGVRRTLDRATGFGAWIAPARAGCSFRSCR